MHINKYRPRSKWFDIYYLSCSTFTVRVICEVDGHILEVPYPVKQFMGKSLKRLQQYANRCGGPILLTKLGVN